MLFNSLLSFFGWQVKGDGIMLKMAFVAAITKWFILRHAAAAQRYNFPALQAVFLTVFIYNSKIAFNS